ncbi:class III lanthionine synthetase LanKC [Streptomyces roseoverticillatus]|uniref:class III lanthionine synthetase LanKC n=1 Tax=Streptomyces roseoverticillatus TaxID=66429 RepID=UPI001F218A2D|nr:class III lanthionine synthetase LanKC [Streptomyces roseoverticillatus]MCF3101957.1 class III lanthionine synthetase LanKC [Streptomyces roseoverticillatus]
MTLKDYDRFYRADPDFFEFPERLADTSGRLSAALGEPPAGWDRTDRGWWVALRPRAVRVPAQGWRIHVSVALPYVARAAEVVRGFCVLRGIPFDVVRSLDAARALAGEHADRLTCGDLTTLHPAGETQLAETLDELGTLLDALPGPYVPGGLRHRAGPLYVRYGSSGTLRCPEQPAAYGAGDEPRMVPALERPDGTLVPENRRPVFRCPDWVALPEFLRPDLEALHAVPDEPLPCRVRRALKVTTGGGTYLAEDRATGTRVVLREARPHTGLDQHGDDAVTRLAREHAVLGRLAGLDCVPRVLGHHVRAGHHFLVLEHFEGRSLAEAAAAAFPLTSEARAAGEAAAYADRSLAVVARIAGALRELHARGVRLGELNPDDVLLRPDGRVVLTALATATDLEDDRAPALGEEGFTAPPGLRGADATAYLLDALRLWLLLPVPHRGPATLRVLTATAEELYPLPAGFGGRLLAGLLPEPAAYGAAREEDHAAMLAAEDLNWPAVRDSLVAGIHAMATPEREDRLFPATPAGPGSLGGHAFGYGAAGVLYALHRVGAGVPDAYVAWLVAAAARDTDARPGLYDGLHGVALVLDLLGRRDEALAVLARCRPAEARVIRPDLAGGKAGIALNLLRFARVTGDAALHEAALRTAGELAALVTAGPLTVRPGVPPPCGLLHGAAGIALLFLHLYEETGEGRWLDLADRTVGHDIARCTVGKDGALTLFDGTHHLPYLHGGSSGLAFPLRGLLRHRPGDSRAATLSAVRDTCRALYVRNAGLLRGRAGAIATLAALDGHGGRPGAAVRTQVRRLAWYAHSYRGHLAFPGFRMLRLSADLATGSAGVLLALGSAFEENGFALPYLDPRPLPRRAEERR